MKYALNIENALESCGCGEDEKPAIIDIENALESCGCGEDEKPAIIDIENALESCGCGEVRVEILTMRTTDDKEPAGYPVVAYNVDLNVLGVAANKADYITLWNSDVDNKIAGTLKGAAYPFSFTFVKNQGPVPEYVYGDPVAVDEDAVIDFDDEPVIDFDDELILY